MHKTGVAAIFGCMVGITLTYTQQHGFQRHNYIAIAPSRAEERCAELADSYTTAPAFREAGIHDVEEQFSTWNRIYDQCLSEDM